MTSVNSPACLLARNQFYRNFPSYPEPVFNCQKDCGSNNHRQVTLWVTVATPPGGIGTKGLQVNNLGSYLHFSTSKPSSPADQGVK